MKRLLAIALVLTPPLFFLGCGGDNPAKPKGDPPVAVYPDRSTPKNTVLRMAKAVGARDTVVTASVYAANYQGSSIDMTDPSSVPLTFSKSDEIRFVAAMAVSSSINYVDMNLYSQTTWSQVHYAPDPPEWITIQIPNFRIEIRDFSGDGYVAGSPSAGESWIFEFTLQPTTPDATSPTDTTWAIVRWVESRARL